VFFCIETLEYLRKGGRIGHVASMLGSVLGIKPIISCGEDGTYYIAGKERGTNRCVQKATQLAREFAEKGKKAEFKVMCSGKSKIPLTEIKEKLEQMMPGSSIEILGQISPVLGVHVGPGLIGVAVYITQ
jgi:DegV family protein with EDD domain